MISFVFLNPVQKKFAICRKECPPVDMSMFAQTGVVMVGVSGWDINDLGQS
jgi:hypothetical protein